MKFGFLFLMACGHARGPDLLAADLAASAVLRDPVTAVSAVDDIFWPAPSPDGRTLFYVSGESGNLDIWAKDLWSGSVRRLTDHSADDTDPAVSPDSQRVAFVSRRDDAKGDLFLVNASGGDAERLTGADTGDRSPVFAADGRTLFFTTRANDNALENIARLDLKTHAVTAITHEGGFDPAVDPSGAFLCFAQPTKDSTRIVVMRLSDGKTAPLTEGLRPEAFPRIARDPHGALWVYYARYTEDDNRDGVIDSLDAPSLYRAPLSENIFTRPLDDRSEPLTSGWANETMPAPVGDRLYFTAQGSAHLEIQVLPLTGMLAPHQSTAEVMRLAGTDLPGKFRRFLFRVVMAGRDEAALRARYELARDLAADNRLVDAQGAFARLRELAGNDSPLGRVARLEHLRNAFLLDLHDKPSLVALTQAVDAVRDGTPLVEARARVVEAECAEAAGQLERALVLAHADGGEDAARSDRVRASAQSIGLAAEDEQRALIALMRAHPEQTREARSAQKRIVDLMPRTPSDALRVAERLADAARDQPSLHASLVQAEAAALMALGRPREAAALLRGSETLPANDRGRMLGLLAEAELAAGDLTAAAAAYEQLSGAGFNRSLRTTGRAGLSRVLVLAAEHEEANGQRIAALAAYQRAAAQDPAAPAAHRKVILLGADLGRAAELYAYYRARAAPYDKTAQYAYGLAATFVGELGIADTALRASLALDSRQPLAHLALGWVREQEEYRHPGSALEEAIDQYTIAHGQFEQAGDRAGMADAALDLGSAFARLAQWSRAFDANLERLLSNAPFQSVAQHVLFLERCGQAAIATEDFDVAIMALKQGLQLSEDSGDERRVGRLRALLALAYYSAATAPGASDNGRAAAQARTQLLLARDAYAARGDTARVVSLDRTLGAMWLEAGNEEEAFDAFARVDAALAAGAPVKTSAGLLTQLTPVDPLDTSRAPFGFLRSDEEEIVLALEARSLHALGANAEPILVRRLAQMDKVVANAAWALPEWLRASEALMRVEHELGKDDRVHALAQAAVVRFNKAEAKRAQWIVPTLRILQRSLPQWSAGLSDALRALGQSTLEDAADMRTALARLDQLRDAAASPAFDPFAAGVPMAASMPASQPVGAARAEVADAVERALDEAEAYFIAGKFAEGEAGLAHGEALADSTSLFDAHWQADYLRFRLGDIDTRDAALTRAGESLVVADVAARLLYPQRERPPLWHALLHALLARAVAQKDVAEALRWQERLSEADTWRLPDSLWLFGDAKQEAQRAALATWAVTTRVAMHHGQPVRIASLGTLIAAANDPLRSMLRCDVPLAKVQAALRAGETFVVTLDGHRGAVTLTHTEAHFGDTASPIYGTRAGRVRVGSAAGLWLSALADNVTVGRSLQLVRDAKQAAAFASDVAVADKTVLGVLATRRIVRVALPAESGAGLVRFALGGANAKRDVLSTSELPGIAMPAAVAVVEAPLTASARDTITRAFALAGTPAVVFCDSARPEWLARFAKALAGTHAGDAWTAAPDAHCDLWGFAGGAPTQTMAASERTTFEQAASAAAKEKRYDDERRLYALALDAATALADKEGERHARSGMAQADALLGHYEASEAEQQAVVAELDKAGAALEAASARGLLGLIQARAKSNDAAAETFARAASAYASAKSQAKYADAMNSEAQALRAAGRYAEAVKAWTASAATYAALHDVDQRAVKLRYIGIVYESNFSDYASAKNYFAEILTLSLKDKSAAIQAKIDLARVNRELAAYEEAVVQIHDALTTLGSAQTKDALSSRTQATLELSRIYWYRGDTSLALIEQTHAAQLADAASSDFLREQAQSLEGLILLSDRKLVPATNRLRRALRQARALPAGLRGEESAQLNNLGTVLRERGLLPEAEKVFAQAIAIDTDLKDRDGLAYDYRNLGIAQLRAGALADADTSLHKALELNAAIGNRFNELQTRLAVAELALVRGGTPREELARIANEAKTMRFADIAWRARFGEGLCTAEARPVLEDALAQAFALGTSANGSLSDPQFNRLTLPALGEALAASYADDPAALWQLLERWRLKELRDQIPTAVLTQRLGLAIDESLTLSTLRERAQTRGDTALVPLLTLAPSPLPHHGAVLSVRVFQSRSVAMTVVDGAATIRIAPITLTDARAAVTAQSAALRYLAPLPVSPLTQWLGEVAEKTLAATELVIVADDTLMALPWAALRVRDKPLLAYLPLRFELSGTHSAAVGAAIGVPRSVAVAGPSTRDALPFAALEADESLALFHDLGRSGERVALEDAPQTHADLLHIAVHGRGGAMRTASLTSEGVGALAPFTVLAQPVTARTVVVSACEGGGGAPFALAFRLAGAARVLAPVERAYDEPTSRFVKLVVRAMARGGGPESLRALALAARDQGEPEAVWANLNWWGGR